MGQRSSKKKKTYDEVSNEFNISLEQQRVYKSEYRSFAASSGLISTKKKIKKKDWMREILSYGSNVTPEWAERLWGCFDRDQSGKLDFCEYLAMSALLEGAPLEKQLEASFRMCDANNDGVLSRDEIMDMLKIVYQFSEAVQYHRCSHTNPTTPEEIDLMVATTNEIFLQADANGDGEIDIQEFVNCMKQNPDVLGILNQFQRVDH
eukprot:TRINITY_DN4866_c0_g1_i1.p1 TRINITY_DN4866_c0_g1~~TRINITY_DN4866_c0_g1_i1.p1  ORF type:complete len:206 (+),score=38.50 TRINITY_DN4866_c0_g1_i1:58-675(+)